MLAKTGVHPKSRARSKAVEERAQGWDKLTLLSLDQDAEETGYMEPEGDGSSTTGRLINEHIGNASLQGQRDGGDFTGVEVGITRECGRDDVRIGERDEGRETQSDEAGIRNRFVLKFDPNLPGCEDFLIDDGQEGLQTQPAQIQNDGCIRETITGGEVFQSLQDPAQTSPR